MRMNSQLASEGWDFTPVLNLINSLSIAPGDPPEAWSSWDDSFDASSEYAPQNDSQYTYGELGNFDKIWEFLGQPVLGSYERLRDVSSAVDITKVGVGLDKAAATVKLVKWRDEIEGGDHADTDAIESSQNFASLGKSEQKPGKDWRQHQAQGCTSRSVQAVPAGLENRLGDEIEGADLAHNDAKESAVNSAKLGKSQQGKYRSRDGRHRARKTVQAPPGGLEIESEPDGENAKLLLDRRVIIQRMLNGAQTRDNYKSSKELRSPREKCEVQSDPESRRYNWRRHLKRPQLPVSSSDRTDYATAAERKARLMSKLRSMFMDEQQYLSNIGGPAKIAQGTAVKETDVHVFVDVSNVRISSQKSTIQSN